MDVTLHSSPCCAPVRSNNTAEQTSTNRENHQKSWQTSAKEARGAGYQSPLLSYVIVVVVGRACGGICFFTDCLCACTCEHAPRLTFVREPSYQSTRKRQRSLLSQSTGITPPQHLQMVIDTQVCDKQTKILVRFNLCSFRPKLDPCNHAQSVVHLC